MIAYKMLKLKVSSLDYLKDLLEETLRSWEKEGNDPIDCAEYHILAELNKGA